MDFSDVHDLAGPPLLERLFLVDPIPTGLALLFLGILLFELLRRRRKEKLATLAFAAGVGLATGVVLVGLGVETPHEQVRRETERFVDLAVAGQTDRVADMISPRLVVVVSPQETEGGDWLLHYVDQLDQIIVENRKKWRRAEVRSENAARSRITLRTETNLGGVSGRYASSWDFYWQRTQGGGWTLVKLEALSLVGQKPWRGWANQIPFPIRNLR